MRRKALIAFDANVATNPKVGQARQALAETLVGWGAEVFLVSLPEAEGVNGPDDYIAGFGDAAMLRVMDAARGVDMETAGQNGKPSKGKLAVEIALRTGIELFHDSQARAFARVRVRTHFENQAVGSAAFKLWLTGLFWETTGNALSREPLNTARDILSAQAVHDGKRRELHNRVAWHDGVVYYDLADDDWRAVKLDVNGWEIVPALPVLFSRHSHEMPQVAPTRGGRWQALCDFLNLDEQDMMLFITVLVAYFLPQIPRPAILLTGEHGSAKSTMLRIARELVDPSRLPLLGPGDLEEFAQILSHHYCVPLDNIGRIDADFSDLLCRAVTGGGMSKRKLFTDEDDVILTFRRAVMVNSINAVVNRPDLLDRSVLLCALPISEKKRRPEQEFWGEFDKAKAGILGALFDLLVGAMRIHPTLRMDSLPRMADFATWGAALAEAMGWGREQFFRAYQADAHHRNQDAIDASPVAQCIVKFLAEDGWEGTVSELLRELSAVATGLGIDVRSREWPKQPHVLSRRINELIPVLRAAAIDVSHGYQGKDRMIKLTTKSVPERASEASAPPVSVENTSAIESTKNDASNAAEGISATVPGQDDFEL